LTLDSDSDVEIVCSPTAAAAAASTSTAAQRPPTSHPYKASAPAVQQSATPLTATTTANMGGNVSTPEAYRPMIRPTTGTTNTGMDVGRSPKRRKLSASTGLANVHQAAQQAGQVNGWQSTFTPNGAAKAGPVNGWQSTFTPNGAAKAGPVNGWQSTPNRVTTQPATATAASSSTSLPSLRPKLNAAKGTHSIT
jgi:hypothetical protein